MWPLNIEYLVICLFDLEYLLSFALVLACVPLDIFVYLMWSCVNNTLLEIVFKFLGYFWLSWLDTSSCLGLS